MPTTSKAFFRVTEYGPITDKVLFFFVGFGTRHWLYYRPVRQLVRAGYHVMVFDYDNAIVWNGNEKVFINAVNTMVQEVENQVARYSQKQPTTFHCFGTSMGTLFAFACTARIPAISKVVLNLSYGSVAHHTASWNPSYTKKQFFDKGITLDQLDEMLKPISPAANTASLKGKKVLLYLARHDKILHHKHAIKLKEALEAHNIAHVYLENKYLGHVSTCLYNFLRPKIYLDFLRD